MPRLRIMLLVALALVLAPVHGFEQTTKSEQIYVNAKQVADATVRVVLSGSLSADQRVEYANVSLYIPQEGVTRTQVSGADTWRIVPDQYGNKLLLLEWNGVSGTASYRVEMTVQNSARYLFADKGVGSNSAYLRENDQIRFTPELRELAFPYEQRLTRAAELTELVHEYVDYDLSLVGELKPSDWVYANRRGVCVEFANMLASLLRINGIPTRYVVGYAYSAVQNKLVGHTWVEVLASDGSWVSFDPTWLEGGYLDATHIKTAVREDANQSDILRYRGRGSVLWTRNDDEISLLTYTLRNVSAIRLSGTSVAFNENGYIKATFATPTYTIGSLNITSCTRRDGKPLLNIDEPERTFWGQEQTVYWFFSVQDSLSRDFIYSCPVTVYDQTGSAETIAVRVTGTRAIRPVFISGPDTASVNEKITLIGSAPGTFYSPELGEHSGQLWDISFARPGTYTVYLYADGALDTQTIRVGGTKTFSLSIDAPPNATRGSNFTAAVHLSNLLADQRTALLTIAYDGSERSERIDVSGYGNATVRFLLPADSAGTHTITATAVSDSVSSYATRIVILEKEKKGTFFGWLIGLIRRLLGV